MDSCIFTPKTHEGSNWRMRGLMSRAKKMMALFFYKKETRSCIGALLFAVPFGNSPVLQLISPPSA